MDPPAGNKERSKPFRRMHALSKIIDRWVGGLLILLLSPWSRVRRKGDAEPASILVVRLWTLGETLLVAPMLSELRARFPSASITVLCRRANRPVVELIPGVDRTILFEPDAFPRLLREIRRYDLSIDTEPWFRVSALLSFLLATRRIGFSHGLRSRLYTDTEPFNDRQYEAQTFLDLLRPLGVTARFAGFPPIEAPEPETRDIENRVRAAGVSEGDIVVGICPGAEDALYRMWPAERFAAVADALIARCGARVILIGSPAERALCERVASLSGHAAQVINLAGLTSLAGLFPLIRSLDLLITNDTGPMHVAAAVGTPTVSLFGPNLPVRFAPRTAGSVALFHGDERNPIINVHEGRIPARPKREHFVPIEAISVEEVLEAVGRALPRRPAG